jgi:hypothetical protein
MLEMACIGICMSVDEDNDVAIPLNASEELHDFGHILFRACLALGHGHSVVKKLKYERMSTTFKKNHPNKKTRLTFAGSSLNSTESIVFMRRCAAAPAKGPKMREITNKGIKLFV